jgi:tRNA U34 5-carboxymethylaminomethyl modifying GTPase MnmE/TrmE
MASTTDETGDINKIISIAIVGNKGAGKSTLLNNCLCKSYTVNRKEDDYCELLVKTSAGSVLLNVSVVCDVSTLVGKVIDVVIIISDVSNANMAIEFNKLYAEVVFTLGSNLKIVNCFNKTDIKDKDTYIFDTALPTFDISAKKNEGIYKMLMFILKIETKERYFYILTDQF